MRRLLPAACILLAGCDIGAPEVIRLGRGSGGKPPPEIWLVKRPKSAPKGEAQAAPAGVPVTAPPREVYEGPVTVGLRKDGACVVAGKAVRDEEAAARLAFVRAERQKAGSSDVQEMTVLVEAQVPMDRVFKAMSGAHHAGFTKIGWRLEPSIALPEPEAVAALLPPDEGRLLLALSADGIPRLGSETLTSDILGARLEAEVASRKGKGLPPPALSLLADRDTPMPAVIATLQTCHAAGIASVALGSPVPVAVPSGTARSADLDFNEAYRNWKLGLESRDVDYSQGPPEYWYYCLYHAFLEEHGMTIEATGGRSFNGKRIRSVGERAAQRLADMAHLLNACDADRAKALDALAADYGKLARDAGDRQIDLELARMRFKGLHDKVNQSFPPSTVAFPADARIEPPVKEKAP